MAQNYISGASSICLYAYEDQDEWSNEAASHAESNETYVPFGQGIEVTVTRNNNAERIYGVGARNASASINKNYDGKVALSGSLSNAYWLLGVLGSGADAGTTGAYTHTYTEADVVPSFTVKTGMELGTTDFLSALVGTKVESATITAAVNEAVKFSLDCSYRYENNSTTSIADNPDAEPIFTFAHGSIELPDGTQLAAVQNFELTMVNSSESLYGVGSRFKKANVAKQREYNFTIDAAFNDPTALLNYVLNGTSTASAPDSGSGTEIATLELTFTNDDGDVLDINLTGIHLNEQTLTQNVNEIVKENVTGWARGCTNAVYTNDVEASPHEAN